MIALAIVAVGLLALISALVVNWRPSVGTRLRDPDVGLGLHRARRTLDTTLLKQDIRCDGRRLRRELRHELEDIEDS